MTHLLDFLDLIRVNFDWALEFTLADGISEDVRFLWLFVLTTYVDMSVLEQQSPFLVACCGKTMWQRTYFFSRFAWNVILFCFCVYSIAVAYVWCPLRTKKMKQKGYDSECIKSMVCTCIQLQLHVLFLKFVHAKCLRHSQFKHEVGITTHPHIHMSGAGALRSWIPPLRT